ncbi:hypothetical protein ECANGB1_1668 [Enterospora canceri]|uniref:Uncharacterized protein n=1 Tax=Enterospora canceri TaxID=1081671 RepID=A0A1Y1S975_9MICR|nr:hypothetical protein ECANGB1_1668 [Enterospora canceri]
MESKRIKTDEIGHFTTRVDTLLATTTEQTQKNEANEEKPEQKAYKASENIKKFLVSDDGLSRIVRILRVNKKKSVMDQVDYVIDFYMTWASSVPVRKTLQINKYDVLKFIEVFLGEKTKLDEEEWNQAVRRV